MKIMRIEIRGNQVVLDGYVNAVARESRVLPSPNGRFKEQVVPKTFERALNKAENVDLLFNHDKDMKLGSIKEGNLELYEDSIGLRAIATVTDEVVIDKAKKGELKGWSFGFVDNKPTFKDGSDGIQLRYLEDIDLLEVSILDKLPAYIATSIEARGEESVVREQRFEENDVKTEVISESVSKSTTTETVKNVDGDRVIETVRERETESFDHSYYEKTIEILKLKGGN
jgi:uncharacterized protein